MLVQAEILFIYLSSAFCLVVCSYGDFFRRLNKRFNRRSTLNGVQTDNLISWECVREKKKATFFFSHADEFNFLVIYIFFAWEMKVELKVNALIDFRPNPSRKMEKIPKDEIN